MAPVVVGTANGLHQLGSRRRIALVGHAVTALAHEDSLWWAVIDGRTIWRATGLAGWRQVAEVGKGQATCLAPSGAGLLVGTAGAHLRRLAGSRLQPIAGFEDVEGRTEWYTPWGGPPDVRSISVDREGVTYANVHVGGIPRSADGGLSWQATIDIDADVHQVLVHPVHGNVVLAASARGLAVSRDAGRSWRFRTNGLHATYMRAVAVSQDRVIVSTSSGPRGERAAIYRATLDGGAPFERCRDGLPEYFSANIDTFCLAASGSTVALATPDGSVFWSDDQGKSWESIAIGLPAVSCVALP